MCGMYLSHVWYFFFRYCVFYGPWVPMGVMTLSFALPIELYKEWLVYKDFFRQTKLVV